MKRIILFACTLFLIGCSANYSDGFRMGIVRKFSKKGLIWKSYEGELLLGGVVSERTGYNTTLVNETWEFSVDLDAVHGEKTDVIISELTKAAESGERVKVNYIQDTRIRPSLRTQYIVQSVEFVN